MENRNTQSREPVDRTLVTALSYLPPLFFLPYLLPHPSKSERFHAAQALVLLVGLLIASLLVMAADVLFRRLLGSIVLLGWYFSIVAWLIRYPVALCVVLVYLVMSALGATNAAAGRIWKVPFAGALVSRALGYPQDDACSDNEHYVK